MKMLFITKNIYLDGNEISEDFIRSSGPGGQNVNKVSTAVQLRFNVLKSKYLPGYLKNRLVKISGKKINSEGELIITSSIFRTQNQNRGEACRRLVELIRNAAIIPEIRRKTKPTRASRRKRLELKKTASDVKHRRKKVDYRED